MHFSAQTEHTMYILVFCSKKNVVNFDFSM